MSPQPIQFIKGLRKSAVASDAVAELLLAARSVQVLVIVPEATQDIMGLARIAVDFAAYDRLGD